MHGGSQRYRWVRLVQWSREPLCLLTLSWIGPPYCSSTLFYYLVSIALQHPTALHYTAVGDLYCGLGNYIPFLIYILTYFFLLGIEPKSRCNKNWVPISKNCCWGKKHLYVNVSDQTSTFTHKTKMLISICWKCILTFNVLNMTKTDGWIQNFKKQET